MSQPRDVDLSDWKDGTKHHPPTGDATVLAHDLVRKLVAELGEKLHYVLPAGRDKSLVFTHLEDVLMRANRAVALGGGPAFGVTVEGLKAMLDGVGVQLPRDPRIEEYEADQRSRGGHTLLGEDYMAALHAGWHPVGAAYNNASPEEVMTAHLAVVRGLKAAGVSPRQLTKDEMARHLDSSGESQAQADPGRKM